MHVLKYVYSYIEFKYSPHWAGDVKTCEVKLVALNSTKLAVTCCILSLPSAKPLTLKRIHWNPIIGAVEFGWRLFPRHHHHRHRFQYHFKCVFLFFFMFLFLFYRANFIFATLRLKLAGFKISNVTNLISREFRFCAWQNPNNCGNRINKIQIQNSAQLADARDSLHVWQAACLCVIIERFCGFFVILHFCYKFSNDLNINGFSDTAISSIFRSIVCAFFVTSFVS